MITIENKPSIDKVSVLNKVIINVPGWAPNLEIHYGPMNIGNVQFAIWKIANTDHTFKVPLKIIYQHHNDNISEHFVKTLTQFRQDYIEWQFEGFTEDWQKRYYDIFGHLIKIY